MDKLRAMNLFVRIVENRSFTKAAEQLGISRVSATSLIRQLESQLKASLLHRTTRQVNPTPDGESYYQSCLAVLAEIEAAENILSQRVHHAHGRLKVDWPASLGCQVVIPALPDFYQRYPDVVLDISVADRKIDLVREGVDCVLRIGELSDSTLIARPLAALPQVTCASRDYIRQYGLPQTLADLAHHQYIEFISATTGRVEPLEFMVDGRRETVGMKSSTSVNNGVSYVSACEAGMGIVQVPRYHVNTQLQQGTLIELLTPYCPPPLPLTLLYPQQHKVPPRLRVFIDWLVTLFAETESLMAVNAA